MSCILGTDANTVEVSNNIALPYQVYILQPCCQSLKHTDCNYIICTCLCKRADLSHVECIILFTWLHLLYLVKFYVKKKNCGVIGKMSIREVKLKNTYSTTFIYHPPEMKDYTSISVHCKKLNTKCWKMKQHLIKCSEMQSVFIKETTIVSEQFLSNMNMTCVI